MKRIIALVLSLVMALSLCTPAWGLGGITISAEKNEPEGKLPVGFPTANVVRTSENENTDIAWGNFQGVAPDPNVNADPQLEAAFTFTCAKELEDVAEKYRDWYCDFYVKLDKDLGANEIFLGGNYGSFGWIGFHNGNITLNAGKEMPLLGSVMNPENPVEALKYSEVASLVGTFLCGVSDVDDALAGATFTVMLRVTNPKDLDDYYDVATVDYTFEYVAEVDGDRYATLQDAVNAADGKTVVMMDDVTEIVTVPAGKNVNLNLNGKTITAPTGETCAVKNEGTLTVEGNGTIAGGYSALYSTGNLTVDGGSFTATDGWGLLVDNIYGTEDSVAVINNGTFTGVGVYNPTNVTINGGTFNVGRDPDDASDHISTEMTLFVLPTFVGAPNTATVKIDGGTFNGDIYIYDDGITETDVTINGGNFGGEFIGNDNDNKVVLDVISITGGYFNTDPSAYCADGYICAFNSDAKVYTVQKKGAAADNGTVKEEVTENLNSAATSDAVIDAVDELEDGNTVTVPVSGNSEAKTTIELTDEGKIAFQAAITENAADPTNKPLEIETEIAISDVTETLAAAVQDEMEAELKDVAGDDAEIAAILDIDIHVFVNDQHVGQLTELPQPITITLDLPEIEEELKDGYRRSYFVIIHHDDVAEKIPATVSGDKLIITSDRFSPYALGYVDTEIPTGGYYPYYPSTTPDSELVKSPDTFDAGIALYVGVSVMGVIGTVVLGKKRED